MEFHTFVSLITNHKNRMPMKNFFALLMLGFMLILVAPVQAMQSGNDCNYSYNIDNANAPPGDVVYSMTAQSEETYIFENYQAAISPENPGQATEQKTFQPVQYAASARDAVNISNETVNYSYLDLAILIGDTGNIPYRMPRDGL